MSKRREEWREASKVDMIGGFFLSFGVSTLPLTLPSGRNEGTEWSEPEGTEGEGHEVTERQRMIDEDRLLTALGLLPPSSRAHFTVASVHSRFLTPSYPHSSPSRVAAPSGRVTSGVGWSGEEIT